MNLGLGVACAKCATSGLSAKQANSVCQASHSQPFLPIANFHTLASWQAEYLLSETHLLLSIGGVYMHNSVSVDMAVDAVLGDCSGCGLAHTTESKEEHSRYSITVLE